MKKILAAVLFTFVIVGFVPNVQAQEIDMQKIETIVEKANTKIENKITKAQDLADEVMDIYYERMDDLSEMYEDGKITLEKYNERVEKVKYQKDKRLDKIIDRLIEVTDGIAKKAADVILEEEGVEVIFEYKPVEIGDRIVMVDPIRVHRFK